MLYNMAMITDIINNSILKLNNSKFFAGIVMLMLNIGSKYITINLSKTQEDYLKNSIGRQLLIFSIAWMGTRDIYMSLGLTAIFIVLSDYLFNEESDMCILPHSMRKFRDVIDTNNDGKISESEIQKALVTLQKAKEQDYKKQQQQLMNSFR
jgi:hypothetical protein